MTAQDEIADEIAGLGAMMRQKLGTGGADFAASLRKARRRLPRGIYRQALILAEAEPLAGHPKLRQTLDGPALAAAARQLRAHLDAVDLADRRKGWWLGMLGGLAFNLLALVAVLLAVLRWRGIV